MDDAVTSVIETARFAGIDRADAGVARARDLAAYTYGAAIAAQAGPRRASLFARWRALRRLERRRRDEAVYLSPPSCPHAHLGDRLLSTSRPWSGLSDYACLGCGVPITIDSSD